MEKRYTFDATEIKKKVNCLDVLTQFKVKYDPYNSPCRIKCPIPPHRGDPPTFMLSDKNDDFHCSGCGREGDSILLYQLLSGKSRHKTLHEMAWMGGLLDEPPPPDKIITNVYRYVNTDGSHCFEVVRQEPKTFYMRRSKHDRCVKDVMRIPYRLPGVQAAKVEGKEILFCWGEKDAETLVANNFTSTCIAGGPVKGINDSKWLPTYNEILTGCHLVIIAPNDERGRIHAEAVATIMNGKALSIKVLVLPETISKLADDKGQHDPADGAADKKIVDITDFFEAGAKEEDLKDLLAKTNPWVPDPSKLPDEIDQSPPSSDADRLRAKFGEIWKDNNNSPNIKYSLMAKIACGYLLRRGRLFYHAEYKTDKHTMFFNRENQVLYKVCSDEFKNWLSKYTDVNRKDSSFGYIHSAVETEALVGKTTAVIPRKYWTQTSDAVYLSCGPGKMMKVIRQNYFFVSNGTDDVLFDPKFVLSEWEIADPVDPFVACDLFSKGNYLSRTSFDLLRMWALNLPLSSSSKPPLLLTGEAGSGKTKIAEGLFTLFGIQHATTTIDSKKQENFWTAINEGGVTCFDNVDSPIDWLPDALCSASTGGKSKKRMLYTDADNISLSSDSWVILTSANPQFASDVALSDRLMVIKLKRWLSGTADSRLIEEIKRVRNAGLCFVCQTIQLMLSDYGSTPYNLNKRHPDFAQKAVKIARALGREAEGIKALKTAEINKAFSNLENNEFGRSLLALMDQINTFTGTTTNLLDKLKEYDPDFDTEKWSPKKIGWNLRILWPSIIEFYEADMKRSCNVKHYKIARRFNEDGSTNNTMRWDEALDPPTPPNNEPPVEGLNEISSPLKSNDDEVPEGIM